MRRIAIWTTLMICVLFDVGCVGVVHVPPGHLKKQKGVVVSPLPAAPVIVLHTRPRLVLIKEWGVQYAPDVEYEFYLFNGVWFTFYNGLWYESQSYGGPWVVVADAKIPVKLKGAQGWRAKRLPPGQMKIKKQR